MKPYQVLKFKSPARMDWPATSQAIWAVLKAESPDASDVQLAPELAQIYLDLHRMVKRMGVRRAYAFCQMMPSYLADHG